MPNRYGLDDDCDAVPYVGIPGLCNHCGTKLTGRRTQWCSDECSDAVTREHNWTWARNAARKRDGHRCVRCRQTPRVRRRVDRISTSRWDIWRLRRLGIEVVDPTPGQLIDVYKWIVHLEVNHIVPREGRGYGWGCHHHLSNLETLCHPCHVAETTRQGTERRAAQRGQLDLLKEA